MAPLLSWLKENWFPTLQGVGIVAGLAFTAVSLRRDAKGRKRTDALALMQQHRELWSEVHRRPELGRILQGTADLIANPITVTEQEFLNLVIIHFNTGWQLAREGKLLKLETLAVDAGGFFSLPLPRAVWEQTKSAREREFVAFVDGCLAGR